MMVKVSGYAQPHKQARPADLSRQFYGYNSVKHGLDFAQDLKLGQYMVRSLRSRVRQL
jgi:hypothetical protein